MRCPACGPWRRPTRYTSTLSAARFSKPAASTRPRISHVGYRSCAARAAPEPLQPTVSAAAYFILHVPSGTPEQDRRQQAAPHAGHDPCTGSLLFAQMQWHCWSWCDAQARRRGCTQHVARDHLRENMASSPAHFLPLLAIWLRRRHAARRGGGGPFPARATVI